MNSNAFTDGSISTEENQVAPNQGFSNERASYDNHSGERGLVHQRIIERGSGAKRRATRRRQKKQKLIRHSLEMYEQ